jgi:hypothetical protein
MVSVDIVIFQTHNPVEPLTRVSVLDITCIVQAGFCKSCRYYQEEDAGRAKESRLRQFRDYTSTLVHDSILNVFLQD